MATTNTKKSKSRNVALATGILPGLKKHFPKGSQKLTFAGGTQTPTVDETEANLQAIIDLRTASTTAKAAAKDAVADENAKLPTLLQFLGMLEAFLRFTFGTNATALADFNLAPPPAKTEPTVETKAVAQAKAKATREARGTVPAKVKKGIKGNVSATLVVTPAEPETPASTPAAPAAAGAPNATTPKS